MKHPIVIIGGGVAGLTAAIDLAKKDFDVLVFEKGAFPRHKVCGEYVSQEVLSYFSTLNVNLYELKPKEIKRMQFSTKNGDCIEANLPMGGLGISRYAFDNFLYEKALSYDKVELIEEQVENVIYADNKFTVETNNQTYNAKIVLGAFGKRSNLDKNLKRPFIAHKTHWLAMKAHYENDDFPDDLVALHNFDGGYCGLSKTESETINVCLLTTYKSFKTEKNPSDFKKNILCENPKLKAFFNESKKLFEKDLTIAQISFETKSVVKNHILMLGDAAGLIHPLCGNGMAMAIHSAKLASETVLEFLRDKSFQRDKMEKTYKKLWKRQFNNRMRTGNILQKILMSPNLAGFSQKLLSKYPSLLPLIIKQTHGNSGL